MAPPTQVPAKRTTHSASSHHQPTRAATSTTYSTTPSICIPPRHKRAQSNDHFTYNYSNGKPKLATDPNGRLTQTLFYDGVGRVIESDQSDVTTPTTLVPVTTYQYIDARVSFIRASRRLFSTASTTDTYDYYDGLGRLLQERTQSQTAGTFSVARPHVQHRRSARVAESAVLRSGQRLHQSDRQSVRSTPLTPTTRCSAAHHK